MPSRSSIPAPVRSVVRPLVRAVRSLRARWRVNREATLRSRGQQVLKAGDPDGAARILEKATRHGQNVDTWYWLSKAYTLAGDSEGAVATLSETLRRNPKHKRATFLKARIARDVGDLRQSREILRGLAKSKKPWVRLQVGAGLLWSDAEEEAARVTQSLMRDLEGDDSQVKRWAQAGLIRGKALIRLERRGEAQEIARRLTVNRHPIAKAAAARLFLNLVDPTEAWRALAPVADYPQFGDLVLRITQSLIKEAQYETVLAIIQQLEYPGAVSPDLHDTALTLKAASLYGTGRDEEANAIALKVARRGRLAAARRRAALLLLNKGDWREGWRQFCALNGSDVSASHLVQAAQYLRRRGHLRQAGEVLDRARRDYPDHELAEKIRRGVAGNLVLLDQGLPMGNGRRRAAYEAVPNRAAYLLHNSLPHTSGGYATRTHGLLTGLKDHGWEMIGVTRLGYPDDRLDEVPEDLPNEDMIDGIPYQRLRDRPRPGPLDAYLRAYSRSIIEMANRERPALLHAASNFWNGAAANLAGARLGLPTVYEVRGLWEVSKQSRLPEWTETDAYALCVRMEAEAATNADAVIAITGALRDEMVGRGVPAEKISLVPNAVDTSRFQPLERDRELELELGLSNTMVIGYVGSVVGYEGLDDLMFAAQQLKCRTASNFKVLVVGDGDALQPLKTTAEDLNVTDTVIFTGRIPHEDVERYYSLIDVLCLPRKPLPVTEMVSPIKPFEAMGMAIPIVVSSVAALAEIVDDEVTGLEFQKGDAEDLVNKLDLLVSNPEFAQKLGDAGRDWVRRERDWTVVTRRVVNLYEALTDRARESERH